MSGNHGHVPAISVALCTYNSERYIEEQLVSILEQDLPVAEVLIGDDGSRDATLAIVSKVAKSHSRGRAIKVVFDRPSGGVVSNFERVLGACSGDYIALSDHDDVWLPHKTSTLVPLLAQAAPYSLAFSDAHIIDDQSQRVGTLLFDAYGVTLAEIEAISRGDGLTALVRRNIVTGATVMLRRGLLELALPFPQKFVHDEWLALVSAVCGDVIPVREPLTLYRIHGHNQIGIPPQSLLGQARIALAGRRERYIDLRDRAEALEARLALANCHQEYVTLLRGKQSFETLRSRMPRIRLFRAARIMTMLLQGKYHRYTHRPLLEPLRDLLQHG